jgi:peptidoglycan/xylan/chitin deacetylase (PgdA/CDA1 family)
MPGPAARQKTDRPRSVLARLWHVRPHRLHFDRPLISFNFDDFPQSAADIAGPILDKYGLRATYYLSTSLFNYQDQAGRYADEVTVQKLIDDGHEIGCHSHGHIDVLHCSNRELRSDLDRFKEVYTKHYGENLPRTFSFPYGLTNLQNKRYLARRFELLRGIRAGINHGLTDLAQLKANELSRPDTIKRALSLIEDNQRLNGLLVFFTHDVDPKPSNFGCRPEDFETVVTTAVESGADIVTMEQVADRLSAAETEAPRAVPCESGLTTQRSPRGQQPSS